MRCSARPTCRGDDRGRHTTVATELVHLPTGGWLIDTPGLRAVGLWSSGRGIERAFADVFDLSERCPVPRLQARGRAGVRRPRRDRGRLARPTTSGQHEAVGGGGGHARGRATGPGQGRRQARPAQAAPAGAEPVLTTRSLALRLWRPMRSRRSTLLVPPRSSRSSSLRPRATAAPTKGRCRRRRSPPRGRPPIVVRHGQADLRPRPARRRLLRRRPEEGGDLRRPASFQTTMKD